MQVWMLIVGLTFHPGFVEYYPSFEACAAAAQWYVNRTNAVPTCQLAQEDIFRHIRPEDGRPRVVP